MISFKTRTSAVPAALARGRLRLLHDAGLRPTLNRLFCPRYFSTVPLYLWQQRGWVAVP